MISRQTRCVRGLKPKAVMFQGSVSLDTSQDNAYEADNEQVVSNLEQNATHFRMSVNNEILKFSQDREQPMGRTCGIADT